MKYIVNLKQKLIFYFKWMCWLRKVLYSIYNAIIAGILLRTNSSAVGQCCGLYLSLIYFYLSNKFRRITRPRFPTQKKIDNRVLFGVEY